MVNKQEIFNIVWIGLKSQDFRQSVNKYESCQYRSGNLKCAFGHLIPDELYDKGIEGFTSDDFAKGDFRERFPELHEWYNSNFSFDEQKFIRQLQKTHDFCNYPSDMQTKLEKIAQVEDLSIPE
jgi:hypothetical protein